VEEGGDTHWEEERQRLVQGPNVRCNSTNFSIIKLHFILSICSQFNDITIHPAAMFVFLAGIWVRNKWAKSR